MKETEIMTEAIIKDIDNFFFNIITAEIMNNIHDSAGVQRDKRAANIAELFNESKSTTFLDERIGMDKSSITYATKNPSMTVRVTVEMISH